MKTDLERLKKTFKKIGVEFLELNAFGSVTVKSKTKIYTKIVSIGSNPNQMLFHFGDSGKLLRCE